MSMLQNDCFNELVAEAKEEIAFQTFDRQIQLERVLEDIALDDEFIERAIEREYWDSAAAFTKEREADMQFFTKLIGGER